MSGRALSALVTAYRGLPDLDHPPHDKAATDTTCGRWCGETLRIPLRHDPDTRRPRSPDDLSPAICRDARIARTPVRKVIEIGTFHGRSAACVTTSRCTAAARVIAGSRGAPPTGQLRSRGSNLLSAGTSLSPVHGGAAYARVDISGQGQLRTSARLPGPCLNARSRQLGDAHSAEPFLWAGGPSPRRRAAPKVQSPTHAAPRSKIGGNVAVLNWRARNDSNVRPSDS